MAVLVRLGYEMVIVPKAAVRAFPSEWEPTEPVVKTKVPYRTATITVTCARASFFLGTAGGKRWHEPAADTGRPVAYQ